MNHVVLYVNCLQATHGSLAGACLSFALLAMST